MLTEAAAAGRSLPLEFVRRFARIEQYIFACGLGV